MVLKSFDIQAAHGPKPTRLRGYFSTTSRRQQSRFQVSAAANGSAPAVPSTSSVRKMMETGETAVGASIVAKVITGYLSRLR
jgi:hypothetical protein